MTYPSWPEEKVSDDHECNQDQRVHQDEQKESPDGEEVKKDIPLFGEADLYELPPEEQPQESFYNQNEKDPRADGDEERGHGQSAILLKHSVDVKNENEYRIAHILIP